jgi:sulfatase maturation enzyme AslB (radical SAM superfamily)
MRKFRGKPVQRVHVMVRPTGALYNLDCTYCYYLSKGELLGKAENWSASGKKAEEFGTTTKALQAELSQGDGMQRLRDMLLAESTLGYLIDINS